MAYDKDAKKDTAYSIKRIEEVDHIVDRMPKKFGVQISIIAMGIIFLLLILGSIISYPDVQIGSITINTETPAIRIFSNTSGKINLLNKNLDQVEKGQPLGYIDNPANMEDIFQIADMVSTIDITDKHQLLFLPDFPKNIYLGAINNKYYAFLSALQQYTNYYTENIFDNQITTYRDLLKEQNMLRDKTYKKVLTSHDNLDIIDNFVSRDSILFAKKVISVAEYERSKINKLNAVLSDVATSSEVSQVALEIFKTHNALNEVKIKKQEMEKSLYLSLSSSFQELYSSLKQFDETFVFRSPQKGKIQYLRFWNNNYFVNVGEPVFSIVPSNNKIIGQVVLPNVGAGKVQNGQEVIIKLDNYPYNEFGSLKGIVKAISMVSNTEQTSEGDRESYLIEVDLPLGLTTNYKKSLEFKYELKGSAEIITKKRLLIERVFENVEYMLSDKDN